jgi:hypothetical protein
MNRTLVSGGVSCYINGKEIGWVTGISFQSNTPRRAINGIDTLVPFELVPLSTEVGGTVQVVKMLGDESLEYRGLLGGAKKIITEKYFTLALVQRNAAGAAWILFRADECSVESQSWDIQPKNVVSGQFTFKGIEAVNAATETENLPGF